MAGPSQALSALLEAEGSPDDACRRIIADPDLLSETRAVLPQLERTATDKAGTDGARRVIANRFELYPQPQRSEAQWATWWADYFDALSEVPLASLEAGMRAWVAKPDSEFMPKPGQLRELAFTAPCRSLGRYYRAKRAIQMAEEKPQLTGPRVDPSDVRAMLSDFQSKIRTEPEKPSMPSIAGKPDERGITPEMRALMARRMEEGR
jgi:hypothetical protein